MNYFYRTALLSFLAICASTTAGAATMTPNVEAFSRAWNDVHNYTAVISVFERQHDQRESMRLNYTFKRPTSVKIHVISGPNAGAFLNWSGGATIQARRGSGILGLFRRNLTLHEPLATTIRGSSIDRLSYGAIIAHIAETKGSLTVDPSDRMRAILQHDNPATDGGLTKEIFNFSPVTHLLVRACAYEEDTLVRRVEFSDVRVNSAA